MQTNTGCIFKRLHPVLKLEDDSKVDVDGKDIYTEHMLLISG